MSLNGRCVVLHCERCEIRHEAQEVRFTSEQIHFFAYCARCHEKVSGSLSYRMIHALLRRDDSRPISLHARAIRITVRDVAVAPYEFGDVIRIHE